MYIKITLNNTTGIDATEFDIYTDSDGYITPTNTNVPRSSLELGLVISVPSDATIVRLIDLTSCGNTKNSNITDIPLPLGNPTCGFTSSIDNVYLNYNFTPGNNSYNTEISFYQSSSTFITSSFLLYPNSSSYFNTLIDGETYYTTLQSFSDSTLPQTSSLITCSPFIWDEPFYVGTGMRIGGVGNIIIQPDGKILLSGNFTSYNDIPVSYLTRLNTNGTLDTSFNYSSSIEDSVFHDSILQPDGKILIAKNQPSPKVYRYNSDGTPDISFYTPLTGSNNDNVLNLKLRNDGKIWIYGQLSKYDDDDIINIGRLNSDGTPDYSLGIGISGSIQALGIQSDNKIVIGGQINFTSGSGTYKVLMLDDTGWNKGIDIDPYPDTVVRAIEIQSDDKILIGYDGYDTGSIYHVNLKRFNSDGTLDTSFKNDNFFEKSGSSYAQGINTIKCLDSGDIIIGGSFFSINDNNSGGIIKLDTNGNYLPELNPYIPAGSILISFDVQNNGKIVFSTINTIYTSGSFDILYPKIGRIYPNGDSNTLL